TRVVKTETESGTMEIEPATIETCIRDETHSDIPTQETGHQIQDTHAVETKNENISNDEDDFVMEALFDDIFDNTSTAKLVSKPSETKDIEQDRIPSPNYHN